MGPVMDIIKKAFGVNTSPATAATPPTNTNVNSSDPGANTPQFGTVDNTAPYADLSQTNGWTKDELNALTANGWYDVSNYRYPERVGVSADLQHYISFYINVRGKSKYRSTYQSKLISGMDENRLNRNQLGNTGQVAGGAIGFAVGAKFGYTIATKVAANLGGAKSSALTEIGVAGTAAAAGYAGAKLGSSLFQPDKDYRINTLINLAIQTPPSVHYGVDYTQEDMGTIAGVMAGGSSAVDAKKMGMAKEAAQGVMLGLSQALGGFAQGLGLNFNPANVAAAGSNRVPNPFREQLFKSVDTRTFKFEYKFLPRSQSEARNVEKIIREFKFHMHPEISVGGLFYIYPSEFNIVYHYGSKENQHINKISTCVLESMTVDYGGQSYQTFKDGMPAEITMRLQFREMETLTKERIDKGY